VVSVTTESGVTESIVTLWMNKPSLLTEEAAASCVMSTSEIVGGDAAVSKLTVPTSVSAIAPVSPSERLVPPVKTWPAASVSVPDMTISSIGA